MIQIIGPSPSGKALGFDLSIRRFESYRPSHFFCVFVLLVTLLLFFTTGQVSMNTFPGIQNNFGLARKKYLEKYSWQYHYFSMSTSDLQAQNQRKQMMPARPAPTTLISVLLLAVNTKKNAIPQR